MRTSGACRHGQRPDREGGREASRPAGARRVALGLPQARLAGGRERAAAAAGRRRAPDEAPRAGPAKRRGRGHRLDPRARSSAKRYGGALGGSGARERAAGACGRRRVRAQTLRDQDQSRYRYADGDRPARAPGSGSASSGPLEVRSTARRSWSTPARPWRSSPSSRSSGRPYARDELAALLWPEADDESRAGRPPADAVRAARRARRAMAARRPLDRRAGRPRRQTSTSSPRGGRRVGRPRGARGRGRPRARPVPRRLLAPRQPRTSTTGGRRGPSRSSDGSSTCWSGCATSPRPTGDMSRPPSTPRLAGSTSTRSTSPPTAG